MPKSNNNFPVPPPPPEPPPTPEPAPAPAPAPTPEPAPAPTPAPTPAPEKTFTQAEMDAAKKQWEADVKKAETRAKMSEDERKDAELKEAKDALRERDTRDSVIEKATPAGIKNGRLFYNAYKSSFTFDDKGEINNFDAVVATAKTESPELFGASTPAPQGSADGGEGKQPQGALTLEKISQMSDAEIKENMEAIDKFFAEGK